MNRFLVKPGTKIKLRDWNPNQPKEFKGKKNEGKKKQLALTKKLGELQEILFAQHIHKILIVLQGMDTSGKDGTVRHVFSGVSPHGMRVANFKAPSLVELDHNYLWRTHREMPGKGEITIFNRSHYEDVLVVRVRKLVASEIWKRRYEQINQFERMLADEGTCILKFFLYIDRDEQRNRLEERRSNPLKNWKLNPQDLKQRKYWDDYMKAYEDVLSKTSTTWAPWYIVPANQKWFRNWVISAVIVDLLKRLKLTYPKVFS